MSIAGLRSFVAKLGASAPVGKAPPTPPHQPDVDGDGSKEFQTPHGPVTLSARELETCAQTGAKPETYAANKAAMQKARSTRSGV